MLCNIAFSKNTLQIRPHNKDFEHNLKRVIAYVLISSTAKGVCTTGKTIFAVWSSLCRAQSVLRNTAKNILPCVEEGDHGKANMHGKT